MVKLETKDVKFEIEKNDLQMFDNIWVSNKITIWDEFPKMLLNKIVRCQSVRLSARSNSKELFPFHEMVLLKQSSFIKIWNSFDCTVVGADGNRISLHELLAFLPNATEIR